MTSWHYPGDSSYSADMLNICQSIHLKSLFWQELDSFLQLFQTAKVLSYPFSCRKRVMSINTTILHCMLSSSLCTSDQSFKWLLDSRFIAQFRAADTASPFPQCQCWLGGVDAYCIIREGCQIQEMHRSRLSCQNYSWKHLSWGNKCCTAVKQISATALCYHLVWT